MIQAVCTNRINIHYTAKSLSANEQQFIQQIKQENTIPNPAYTEAQKRGRWTGRISPVIALVQIEPGGISVPRGYASRLLGWAKHYGVEIEFKDNRRERPMVLFRSQIQLKPYQRPAVEAMLKGTQGILEAPAGSGKTSMGMEIIARVGQPALWIAHTKDLANQAMERADQYLKLIGNEIGLIGNGKRQVGEKLTVALVQTLTAMKPYELQSLLSLFGLIVLDEAQHAPAVTFSGVIDQAPARWRYGLTATPTRGDGLEILIDRFIGPKLCKVERSAVELSGGVIAPRLRIINTTTRSETFDKHETRTKQWEKMCEQARLSDLPEPRQPQLNYTGVMNDILRDPERNHLIVQTLIQECPGHYSLVLSDRVEHIKALCDMVCAVVGLKCAVVHGKLPIRERERILDSMKSGNLDVLFAVDLAKEGLDIPRLDRLFLVSGGNSEAELEQKVGRIQRAFWGKRDAVVFDFVDECIPVLKAQFWTRRKVYLKLGMLGTDRRQTIAQ